MLAAVYNPVSGRGTAKRRLARLRDICARLGRRLEVVESRGPGGVAPAVLEAVALRPDALVLVGGDGSVGEACGAYATLEASDRPPVVLVPGGRGNSFYRAALSDAPWPDYVERALRTPNVRALDAARIRETGRVWALGCSLGFFRDSVAAASRMKGLRGRALYAAAGAHAATHLVPFSVEVVVDGELVHGGRSVLAAVAGGPYRGGRLLLFPEADLCDGLLDCVVISDVGTHRFAEILGAASDARHVAMPGVHVFRGARVELRSPEPLRLEVDGTEVATDGSSITCDALPGVLPLAYPAGG